MVDFRMPSLGADMEAGTLVEWLVKPGDRVKRGDVVAVVETQKGAIEIETFQPGQIEKFLVELNSKVPVGTPLAQIRTEGEAKPAAVAPAPAPPPAPVARLRAPAAAPITPPVAAPVRAPSPPPVAPAAVAGARASPAARKLAEERGIDLSTVTGSGPGGAITYADVEHRLGAVAAPPEKKRAPGLDLEAMRTAIAAAMARSKREIPHYYLEHQVDVTACEHWLAQKNATLPPDTRLLFGALPIKAVALAARRYPAFNGFYRDNKFEPAQAVHVGVAIAIRGGGLTAPALHDADQLSLDDLDEPHARPDTTHARRPHPQFGDVRSDHHCFEPRRTRSRSAVRNHLSAASGDRRYWQGGDAAVGCRRRHRTAVGDHHDAIR